jgi:tripartite-type tricarboxylate transporter receptor subunit TctC
MSGGCIIAGRAFLPLILLLFMRCALAQFPERPIELVIPFDAGGGADIEGRLLAEEMSKVLGVPVVPVNKPGAGGAVAYAYVRNAAPDGYTIAWSSSSILTMTNLGNVDFAYDALAHIGRVEFQPMVFAVSASSRWSDFESFARDCAAAPSGLRVSNSGTGSATHVGALALMSAAGCEVVHLPVGTRRRNATVLSGEADAMVGPLTEAVSLARAGRLRLLATMSVERNAVIPDVPTAAELGFDARLDLFRGVSVPIGTPGNVTALLADAMTRAAGSAAFADLAREVGFTVDPLPAEAFAALLRVEDAKVRAVIRDAGLSGSQAP